MMTSGEQQSRTLFEAAKDELRNNPCGAMPVPEAGPHEPEIPDVYILAAFDNAAFRTFTTNGEPEFLDDGGDPLRADRLIRAIIKCGQEDWSRRRASRNNELISTQA